MSKRGNNSWLFLGGAFLIGLLVGWIVLGWWLFPVSWTGATLQDVTSADKQMVLETIAEAYQADPNPAVALDRLQTLGSQEEIEQLMVDTVEQATANGDLATVNQINALAGGVGLAVPGAPAQPQTTPTGQESQGIDLGAVLRALLGLAVLLGGIALALWLLSKRRGTTEESSLKRDEAFDESPEESDDQEQFIAAEPAPAPAAAPARAAPLMQQYSATFVPGDMAYDETFSIEAPGSGYLGECGMTISEMVSGDPNRVTALEVWLFDKSDIRTVTKVLMSDYAYGNPALREKLSSRGDAVLARPGAAFVLDAQTLRLEGQIRSMEYAEGEGPAHSAFRRLTVDLRVMRQSA